MSRKAMEIVLNEPDRLELTQWVSAHRTPQQVAQRCRIILSAAEGREGKVIAHDIGINYKTVALWRRRFHAEGVDYLWEVAAGRGRNPEYSTRKVKAIGTHDYQRNGTTTLFAALEIAQGKVGGTLLCPAPASEIPKLSASVG